MPIRKQGVVPNDMDGASIRSLYHDPNSKIEKKNGTMTTGLEGDRELALFKQQDQREVAAQLLQVIGGMLQGADSQLSDLETNADLLPSAILRQCRELADGMAHVADELDAAHPGGISDGDGAAATTTRAGEDRQRALARALHQDFTTLDAQLTQVRQDATTDPTLFLGPYEESQWNDLTSADTTSSHSHSRSRSHSRNPSSTGEHSLHQVSDTSIMHPTATATTTATTTATNTSTSTSTPAVAVVVVVVVPTEDDFLRAIQGASSLLRDLEAAIREITERDAEDIADASLTLARLFLLSLQNVHDSMTPDDLILESSSSTRGFGTDPNSTLIIEELTEEDDCDSSSSKTPMSNRDRDRKHKGKRTTATTKGVRVLWPRVGPLVQRVLEWGQETATHHPILAVALGLTLWPAAMMTTAVGGSLVLIDHALQSVYDHWQDAPLVQQVELGAAQLVQAGQLGWVVSHIVGKQTLRVTQRQIQRQGGLEQICQSLLGASVDRLMHPIETVGMVWNGAVWGVETVSGAVQNIMMHREDFLASTKEGILS